MLSPFRRSGGLWDWQGEMNRMFEQMFGDLARMPRRQLEE